jgi:hypothetical protein
VNTGCTFHCDSGRERAVMLGGDNDEFLLAEEKLTFGVERRVVIIIIHSGCLA